MNCPHCLQALPADQLAVCPACGKSVQPANTLALSPEDKRGCWTVFWFSFLLTPVLSLLTMPAGVLVALGGTLISGFALARGTSQTVGGLVARAIVFSILVAFLYAGVIFVGCAMLFNWK